MERVYLLLRNNFQSGPFTIGELLQQQLKPSDMIWIEGKSAAWTYLSELELTPYSEKIDLPKKVEEIKGKDEIERKAEELRQKILTAAPKRLPPVAVEIETYASSYKLPENDIRFIDHRKERKIILSELAITLFVIGLFGIGVYKGREFLSQRKTVQNSVATKLVTNDQHSAQKHTTRAVPLPLPDSTQETDSLLIAEKPKPKSTVKKAADSVTATSETVIITPLNPTDQKNQENTEKLQSENTTQPIVKVPEQVPVKKEVNSDTGKDEKNVTEEGKEEKKGFLKGLFKKKKKD